MTDDLIARLRYDCDEMFDPICGEAADALEEKDGRIKELEEERRKDLDYAMLKIDETIELRARIAALEAALKPFADEAAELDTYQEPFEDDAYVHMSYFKAGELRAARAAMEEK